MLKKILIFSHAMEIGGAERALLGFLETINTEKYSVDLFLMRHTGELLQYVPKKINLLPEIPQYASLAIPLLEVLKRRQIQVALGRLYGKWKAKQKIKKLGFSSDNGVELEYSHKFTLRAMPPINETEYDLAISFLTPHYFVAEKVKAKRKIAWIHTDYGKVNVEVQSELKMWEKYDVIASISDSVTKSFLKVFPSVENKIQLIENIMPMEYIKAQVNAFSAEEEMPMDGSIRLLSIGRFCIAKNFDNVPFICKKLREYGLDIKWYLMGFGGEEHLLRAKIEEAGVQEYVLILGKKENPYPYIASCDWYVQPSRYEGKCVSVTEAQILNKPVIITNYATSESQLIDGYDGIVVPIDNDKCAAGIADAIRNKELQQQLIGNTKKMNYANAESMEKIDQLMEV